MCKWHNHSPSCTHTLTCCSSRESRNLEWSYYCTRQDPSPGTYHHPINSTKCCYCPDLPLTRPWLMELWSTAGPAAGPYTTLLSWEDVLLHNLGHTELKNWFNSVSLSPMFLWFNSRPCIHNPSVLNDIKVMWVIDISLQFSPCRESNQRIKPAALSCGCLVFMIRPVKKSHREVIFGVNFFSHSMYW